MRFQLRRVEPLLGVALVLLAWWLITDALQFVSDEIFASPTAVFASIIDLTLDPFAGHTLFGHIAASASRWFVGVLVGCAIGVPLGIAMAWSRAAEAVIAPIFEVFRYIPPFAWVPLAILWFGTSLQSQAAVVAIAALPPALLNAHRAVLQIDPVLLDAAAVLGSRSRHTLRDVVLPTAAPGVFTGVRLAFSNGWMALVGAELVGASSGLGYVIVRAQSNLSTDMVIAGMVTIAAVGVAIDTLLRRAVSSSMEWSTATGDTER